MSHVPSLIFKFTHSKLFNAAQAVSETIVAFVTKAVAVELPYSSFTTYTGSAVVVIVLVGLGLAEGGVVVVSLELTVLVFFRPVVVAITVLPTSSNMPSKPDWTRIS